MTSRTATEDEETRQTVIRASSETTNMHPGESLSDEDRKMFASSIASIIQDVSGVPDESTVGISISFNF